ncbi:cytidine deaminase [Aethina tumida]|uniref:cytidine deaminase n=1 Tax=Aethina tumida TaxID=116153 RepID=UPI00096AE471|nr:cytidine deaminase [Aethina tumida]
MSTRNHNTATVVNIKQLDGKVQNILREAVEARSFAYAPYSNFQVGAALQCEDGTLYRGCNVENSSFTVGTCAERNAYFKAISEGQRKFKAIAVIAYQEKVFTMPCGACRQLMAEFGNLDVYIAKPELCDVMVTSLNELLPFGFVTDNYKFT